MSRTKLPDIMQSRQVVIAGAGVAGLTAALALAARGFGVHIYERSPVLQEVGAGLQLSPNATRILDGLGVLDHVMPMAVRPEAVVLRDAATLIERARVPLGNHAERRWNAPYLVIHRADLQKALLTRVAQVPEITLATGTAVTSAAPRAGTLAISIEKDGVGSETETELFVAADGVWSSNRRLVGPGERSRFSGELAWRTTIALDSQAGQQFEAIAGTDCVTTFLHSGFHMVAYPVRAGSAINLVAFTPGKAIAEQWSGEADPDDLKRAMRGTAPALLRLVDAAGPWTIWPLHTVDASKPWTTERMALIGDAAHAMTPFAAQGAAMAIEDAYTLAAALASAAPLGQWEAARKQRVSKVARRGALNHLAWHAAGPVALARNLFLKTRSPQGLAADMDWLYGWTPPGWSDAEL